MALTHTQYDEIMREYENKRERARHNAEEAKRKVEEAVPAYRETEDKITTLAVECAQKALDGEDGEVSQLKSEIASLTSKLSGMLTENGFPEDYLEERYECPDCKDTGYTDGTTKCHCLKQAILRYTYHQSNIEDILLRENFDTLRYDLYTDAECEKMKGVISECRRFVDDFGKKYENVLLYGNVGVGKTFLTNCMAKALLDEGYSVIYFTSIRLFDILSRGLYKYAESDAQDIQNDIFTCDLLIIDDLGTEGVNSFVAQRLFDILNERDLRRKSTIISTNLPFEEVKGRYTERNFSRIFGNYIVLHPDVQDIRIRKRRATR